MTDNALTPQEHDLLQTFLAHAKPGRDLSETLSRFTSEAQSVILNTCHKLLDHKKTLYTSSMTIEKKAAEIREYIQDSRIYGQPVEMDNSDHIIVAAYWLGYVDGQIMERKLILKELMEME